MDNNNIIIKKPSIDQLDELFELWVAQWEYHTNLDPVYYLQLTPELKERTRKYLEKLITETTTNIWIAEINNKIAGFITFKKSSADYSDTNINEYGSILELYVSPNFRKMGIGNKLMKSVEKYFKSEGLKYVGLNSSTFNTNALNFYEGIGFVNRQTTLYKEIDID